MVPTCAIFRHDDAGSRAGAPPGREPTREPDAGGAGRAGRETERTAVAAPGDRRQPDRTDPGASSPRRQASQRLVEEGKGYAIAGRDEQARQRFEDALRVDGSNGEAYLQLAQLAADQGDWGEAEGFYDQASTLLSGLPEWAAPLDDLARRIAERR
jgi:tetratricopeptide (TPR) repeat protein